MDPGAGGRQSPLGADDASTAPLAQFSARRETFRDWNKSGVSADDLAMAGFYYTGEGDRVRCPYCQAVFEHWHPRDVPYAEHRRQSPDCPFVMSNRYYPRDVATVMAHMQDTVRLL